MASYQTSITNAVGQSREVMGGTVAIPPTLELEPYVARAVVALVLEALKPRHVHIAIETDEGELDGIDADEVLGQAIERDATIRSLRCRTGPAGNDFRAMGLLHTELVWTRADRDPATSRIIVTSERDEEVDECVRGLVRRISQYDSARRSGEGLAAPGVDEGPALLDPVTQREYRAIERLLAILWEAVDGDLLSEAQQTQITAMANLIRAEQLANTPGKTPRWGLVGVVGGALRYLAREAPKDALAWWKLAELLAGIDWVNVSRRLPV